MNTTNNERWVLSEVDGSGSVSMGLGESSRVATASSDLKPTPPPIKPPGS